jgi:uncharacterized protein YjbI with pentapeptide repeats
VEGRARSGEAPAEDAPKTDNLNEVNQAVGDTAFLSGSVPRVEGQARIGEGPEEDAEKADELDELKKAIDDAASVSGTLWFSYLGVLFYLGVAAGAVTHKDLFLENAVKLPFLNVDLPLRAFFFVAPILFVIVHAYTLLHLVILTEKVKHFQHALRKWELKAPPGKVENLQWRMPSNIFIQFLAGPPDLGQGRFGLALRAIAWITLVIAPLLLLLLMQIQFLPYHHPHIIWIHRLALLADLIVIWWLWRKILAGRENSGQRRKLSWVGSALALLLSACALVFSWALASFPGERQWDRLAAWRPVHERDSDGKQIMVSVNEWIFTSKIDPFSRRRRWPLSSTLALSGFNLYDELNIDDPDKAKAREFVFHARKRDLRGANFDSASLPKVDFEGAELQGASLASAQLQGSSFFKTHLEGASLDSAGLQGVLLDGAYLEGASLVSAELQGASLADAQLQGASLEFALLQGASLVNAKLQGASLDHADLDGASLGGAWLQGASLKQTILGATDLSQAHLWHSSGSIFSNDKIARQYFNAINFPDSSRGRDDMWRPSWDEKSYQTLYEEITESVPIGKLPPTALNRVLALDCASPSSCDPDSASRPEDVAWRQQLEKARVDPAKYTGELGARLKDLVCSSETHSIEILRGISGVFPGRGTRSKGNSLLPATNFRN